MKRLLTGDRIGRDWHDAVLVPTIPRVLFVLRGIATGFIFPPHVPFPVGITELLPVRTLAYEAVISAFISGSRFRLSHVGVLPVTAAVAHRDGTWMNTGHRYDRHSHRASHKSA